VKTPFSGHQDRIDEIRASIQRLSEALDSAPASTEEQARARARELRNVFMAALPEIGAQSTFQAMGPMIRRFRQDVGAKGFDVSTEIHHVYLALELLDRPLEREAHRLTLLAIDALRAET
jgi:hypothetical protein